jgi:hypothetical protein
MACENGGDFADIMAMGAVKSATQKYFDTLSLPLEVDDKGHARWTSVYANAITGQHTVSAMMPAFSTNVTNTNVKLEFQGEREKWTSGEVDYDRAVLKFVM